MYKEIVTEDIINDLSEKFNDEENHNCSAGYAYSCGAMKVKKIYDKELTEIYDKIYGNSKIDFVKTHLLRYFNTDQLIVIRDFLIARTPKND